MRIWNGLAAILTAGLGVCVVSAEDPAKPAAPKPAAGGALVITDAAGKEQKVTRWQFTAGTRRLEWLAPAKAPAKEPTEKTPPGRKPRRRIEPAAPAGPEALEFLTESEIKYLPTVLTLIPLDRVRSLEFDGENNTATVRVTGDKPDVDLVLTGSTKYKRLNKVVVEAEVDKGEAGVAAIKYVGGVPRGIRGIRFPSPVPPGKTAAGRPVVVIAKDGEKKTTHPVTDLLALYRMEDGSERLVPTLMFKKTLKLDVNKIKKIVAPEGETDELSWQVIQKDGDDTTLTLLRTLPIDGKPARLEGLLGRVPAGYKLFPPETIQEIRFDTTDGEEKKEEKKEDKKEEKKVEKKEDKKEDKKEEKKEEKKPQ